MAPLEQAGVLVVKLNANDDTAVGQAIGELEAVLSEG